MSSQSGAVKGRQRRATAQGQKTLVSKGGKSGGPSSNDLRILEQVGKWAICEDDGGRFYYDGDANELHVEPPPELVGLASTKPETRSSETPTKPKVLDITGPWAICEDEKGMFFVHAETNAMQREPPEEVLLFMDTEAKAMQRETGPWAICEDEKGMFFVHKETKAMQREPPEEVVRALEHLDREDDPDDEGADDDRFFRDDDPDDRKRRFLDEGADADRYHHFLEKEEQRVQQSLPSKPQQRPPQHRPLHQQRRGQQLLPPVPLSECGPGDLDSDLEEEEEEDYQQQKQRMERAPPRSSLQYQLYELQQQRVIQEQPTPHRQQQRRGRTLRRERDYEEEEMEEEERRQQHYYDRGMHEQQHTALQHRGR